LSLTIFSVKGEEYGHVSPLNPLQQKILQLLGLPSDIYSSLEAMGLSISDAIRLLMLRIADERRLPFEVKVPNATTRKAIAELEAGKGKSFKSVEALMSDLNAND
jgi:DNA-damage-inducible protein J